MYSEHFINCSQLTIFNTLKLSANINNTTYTIGPGGTVYTGTPDISYESIVFVSETKCIWTHGDLYTCSSIVNAVPANDRDVDSPSFTA